MPRDREKIFGSQGVPAADDDLSVAPTAEPMSGCFPLAPDLHKIVDFAVKGNPDALVGAPPLAGVQRAISR